MVYKHRFDTPLGTMVGRSDGGALTGLWFEGQKYMPRLDDAVEADASLPVFEETARWLDIYFSGKQPAFTPSLRLEGTQFQRRVWAILQTIPYGSTVTYGDIAKRLGIASGQAVGGALGRNPISIIVPCHRVLGADGSLTGYAGGIERKRMLLSGEGVEIQGARKLR